MPRLCSAGDLRPQHLVIRFRRSGARNDFTERSLASPPVADCLRGCRGNFADRSTDSADRPFAGPRFKRFAQRILGGLVANLLGILLIRNVAGYPGVERASDIIPGFLGSFGILVVMLMMLRLDYSCLVVAGAYIFAIFIFYFGFG